MSENSKIEWCDHTFNPHVGCTKIAPACDNCFAEGWAKRSGLVQWGPHAERRRTSVANWAKPLRWNRAQFWQCGNCGWRGVETDMTAQDDGFGAWVACPHCCAGAFTGARQRVFCASLADVFDNTIPVQWRIDLMSLILKTPNLDWLLLTKRIGNAAEMLEQAFRAVHAQREGWAENIPSNVWIGATITSRDEMLRDGPKLKQVPARVRFWSVEPMLGDLGEIPRELMPDWVIVGGESGPGARPMHPEWARGLRDQCDAAGVPFLFKQWGEWGPTVNEAHYTHGGSEKHAHAWIDGETADGGKCWLIDDDGVWSNWTGKPRQKEGDGAGDESNLHPSIAVMGRVGKKAAGRLLDAVEHNGFPTN